MKRKNRRNRNAVFISSGIFVFLAICVIWIGGYYYLSYEKIATDQVISQRETIAALSASAMKVKLDQLVSLAHRFASQADLQSAVQNGEWANATKVIENREASDPTFYDYYVDRIFLLDTKGTIMSTFPAISEIVLAGLIKHSMSGTVIVTRGEDFYVSNVERRDSMPQLNVVKILVPIMHENVFVGVLRLDIPTNDFSDFGKDVDVGKDGFAYFVDRIGQIVTHPKFSSNGAIIDYNSVPAVQAVMQNSQGFDIAYNPIENQTRIAAYQKVPVYGWGVIAQEPVVEAFSSRDAILNSILEIIALGCIGSLAIAYWIFMNI